MAKGKKPRGGRSKRVTARDIEMHPGHSTTRTPAEQFAAYYGGYEPMLEQLRKSDELQQNVYPTLTSVDPELAGLFPPVAADNYMSPQLINVVPEGAVSPSVADTIDIADVLLNDKSPMPGIRVNPQARGSDTGLSYMGNSNLTMKMVDQPMTSLITDPLGTNPARLGPDASRLADLGHIDPKHGPDIVKQVDLRGTPLIPRDESSALAEMLLGDPEYAYEADGPSTPQAQELADAIAGYSTPNYVDQMLGNVRRAQSQINANDDYQAIVNRMLADNEDDYGLLPEMASRVPGLTTAELIAMRNLPQRIKNFLPARMGMIPAIVGGTAAGAAAGYSMSQDPNMTSRSTMRGISY